MKQYKTETEEKDFFDKYVDNPIALKETGYNYSKRIGTVYNFDFGCDDWMTDLEQAFNKGLITCEEHDEIKKFGKSARFILSQTDNAKDARWFYLNKWIGDFFFLKEFTPENIGFFERKLEEEKGNLDAKTYLMIWYAFNDIDAFTENAKREIKEEFVKEFPEGMSAEEKMQKAKGRSFLIALLIIIFQPLPFCLIGQSIIGGIALWGLCSPIVLPLTFIIAALVSDSIAEATVGLKPEEQSEDYKAMKAATKAGFIVGGIHAGIGAASELRKPGWIKDSK